MNELTEATVVTMKDAAKKMTGANRRAFEAQVVLDYLGGDARLAETVFPAERTMNTILNRMGYRLRAVQKTKPIKRIPETHEIFENVKQANAESDAREDSLRISIDGKAKVNVGDFSRGGQSRGNESVQALDHDFGSKKS